MSHNSLLKCQFPLYLRDHAGWAEIPALRRKGGQYTLGSKPLPRTIRSDEFMALLARVEESSIESKLLKEYISFLLKDDAAINQFWSVGYSYFALKPFEKHRNLLSPLVVFKVRGSVMASGGHEPENFLRARMSEWGLVPNVDFNTNDVIVLEKDADPDRKTRAYDFVLPYKTPGWATDWQQRLFIQCQFYAGDSGSVSHKNVDQTNSSRNNVLSFVPDATFLEYVDGAGYFSSLNGDLNKLLGYRTTKSFFQINTAPIRLRRELQQLGFLVPLEIEHAIACTDGTKSSIVDYLKNIRYNEDEIHRALTASMEHEVIRMDSNNRLSLDDNRRDLVRRYLLLDTIAQTGSPITPGETAGKILIPGYGPFYGLPLDTLTEFAEQNAPQFADDLRSSKTFLGDVRWLCEEGLALAR